jgi:hypothetical protein
MAIKAQQVVDRIRAQAGASGNTDAFVAGMPDLTVTGIATTWSPTMDVLRKAVAQKRNLVLSLESAYWSRSAPGAGPALKEEAFTNDPTYKIKHSFIQENNLAIYRIRDTWTSRSDDGQLRGLAKALNWDKYYRPAAGTAPWSRGNHLFSVPGTSFGTLVADMKRQLKARAIRCLGDPKIRVAEPALTHGYFLVPDLEKVLEDPKVEVVVCGEPCEWEAGPYFMDVIASGQKKGMIVLGSEVSSEPGCGELAAWVKGQVSEVPVEWIPAGEPFTVLR